jgi:hypothetical protein
MPLIESSPQVQRKEVCNKTTRITLVHFLAFLLFTNRLCCFVRWLSPRLPLIYAALQQAGPPPPAATVQLPANLVVADAPVGTPAPTGVPDDAPTNPAPISGIVDPV